MQQGLHVSRHLVLTVGTQGGVDFVSKQIHHDLNVLHTEHREIPCCLLTQKWRDRGSDRAVSFYSKDSRHVFENTFIKDFEYRVQGTGEADRQKEGSWVSTSAKNGC